MPGQTLDPKAEFSQSFLREIDLPVFKGIFVAAAHQERELIAISLVEVTEVEEDPATWPFADRVYVFTDGTPEDVANWTAILQPDAIEECLGNGKPDCAPEMKPGYKCYDVWWD